MWFVLNTFDCRRCCRLESIRLHRLIDEYTIHALCSLSSSLKRYCRVLLEFWVRQHFSVSFCRYLYSFCSFCSLQSTLFGCVPLLFSTELSDMNFHFSSRFFIITFYYLVETTTAWKSTSISSLVVGCNFLFFFFFEIALAATIAKSVSSTFALETRCCYNFDS